MSFSYANPTSGPSAGGIGWLDFGTLNIAPGQTVTGLTGTLNDGSVVTFDLSLAFTSGQPRTFTATSSPVGGSFFGNAGYTGIAGNVVLYSNFNFAGPGVNTFTINNIVVKDSGGNPVPNYTVILADSETSNTNEAWGWQTNGGVWQLLATLGSNPPILTGIGTQNVTITGTQLFPEATQASYVTTTETPTQLIVTSVESLTGRQGFSIGFATTRISFQKNIGQRINPADQFVLSIESNPSSQIFTTGSSNGIQPQVASVYAVPGRVYNINEVMAPGSVSLITDYTRILSSMNATPAGTVPPTGSLPLNFTPALGDDVTFTILNAAPNVFTKTVDKAYTDTGEILTYTVTVDNPNSYPINNVVVVDPLPQGVSYIGNLTVSVPYTGSDPASGIILTTIAPNSTATISWQVRVNTQPPISNPIVNIAEVTVPGGNSGMTNPAMTQINHAYVSILKSVDKPFAQPGEILTYTLQLNNEGNTPATSISIADVIPSGTVYVPGSVTAEVPFTGAPGGTLLLTNPLPAGAGATVSFQVKVNEIPAVNPIPNTASVSYVYTVDPTIPVYATATNTSNTVTTLVSFVELKIKKTVDKSVAYIGDIITYQLAITATGNVPADEVVITDVIPNGGVLVPGSLVVSVPYTGTLPTLTLTNSIMPDEVVTVIFKVQILSMPNPNPMVNQASVDYSYTLNPEMPDGVTATATSGSVTTLVFRNNYGQQINDLIESVAMEQAGLAAIINAEGSKIQRMVAMNGVTPQELLCLNKSMADMTDAIALLESILKQKLNIVNCQINGRSC